MTLSAQVDIEAIDVEVQQLRAAVEAALVALDVARSLLIDGPGQLNSTDDHLSARFAQAGIGVNGVDEIDLRTRDAGADQER